jgi:hypothetical protein
MATFIAMIASLFGAFVLGAIICLTPSEFWLCLVGLGIYFYCKKRDGIQDEQKP